MLFIKILGLLLVLFFAYQGIRMYFLFQKTLLLETLASYEQEPIDPQSKILVVGDSTAVGTGSASDEESIAGRLGAYYPDAQIINKGINGQKIKQLVDEFDSNNFPHVDLLIIQIGANDIVQFTPINKVRNDLKTILSKATMISPKVVILHGGNIGSAPFFPYVLQLIYERRTRQFRDLYKGEAEKHGVIYVDLFQDRAHDIFLTDPQKYYAADKFHPSSDGYKVWFDEIINSLKNKHGTIDFDK